MRRAAASAPSVRLITRSEAETEALGASLAPLLEPGDVIALIGPLGAGKTRFVAGLAHGLNVKARVRSPTFTLVNEYHGRLPLLHVDLYRLEPRDVDGLALEERLDEVALVVEWGEKLPERWRADAMEIRIEPDGSERTVDLKSTGSRSLALLNEWRPALSDAREAG